MPTPKQGYFLKDGTKIPSVTTILGRWKESGALMQWAFQQGKAGKRTLYEDRDAAADIGTMAHAMCDAWMRGDDPMAALAEYKPTDEQKEKATTAFNAFLTWVNGVQAKPIACEQQLVSEVHRFGGTPDFLLRMPDGRLAMADLKTSNGIYRDMVLQVAAYGCLWNECHEDDQVDAGFHVLRLGKENPDFEHRYFGDLADALELFLLLRRAYDMDYALKKRAA